MGKKTQVIEFFRQAKVSIENLFWSEHYKAQNHEGHKETQCNCQERIPEWADDPLHRKEFLLM